MTLLHCVQIEQELGLILGKSDAPSMYPQSYGEKSCNGANTSVITSMKPTGKLLTFSPECLCFHSDLYR